MSYEQSSSTSSSFYQSNNGGVANECGVAFGGGLESSAPGSYSGYESTSGTGYGLETDDAFLRSDGVHYSLSSSYDGLNQLGPPGPAVTSGNVSYQSSNFQQRSLSSATSYATGFQGLFQDPNPEIVRRPAMAGVQTYTQRVVVKFLKPPSLPEPGPLIIKEVRPPQPPPPPPLYIRQRPPPPPVLAPLVIREAPPKLPAAVGTQVVTKMLPPLPVPPRSVIIERLPPLPPKPRDVIVERWLPYRAQQKRRVIIQRAPPAVVQKPRNIIIYYEPPKTQIVRQFRNLGVQRANPHEYVARYGAQLEDSQTLVTHARQAGVVEDITPPTRAAADSQSASYENYQSNSVGRGTNGYDLASGVGGISSSNYEATSTYNTAGGANGYTVGSESSFDDFVNNPNDLVRGRSSYESYSSQRTYS